MGIIRDLGRLAWRLFNTDGVPESGNHEPNKTEILAFVDELDRQVTDLPSQTEINDFLIGVQDDLDALEATEAATQTRLSAAEADIDALGDATQALAIARNTWLGANGLVSVTGTVVGQIGEVPASDIGTHTDPVVGGTVANSGRYAWSASPAGWQWIEKSIGGRLDDLLAETVPIGDTVEGGFPFLDNQSKPFFGIDPSGGPAIVHHDRAPNLSTLNFVLCIGQSQMAVGLSNGAAIPAIHTISRRPNRFLMWSACGLNGLAGTDVGTLNLGKIVSAMEIDTESNATGFMIQLLSYEDKNRLLSPPRVVANTAQGGALYSVLKKGSVHFANGVKLAQDLVKKTNGNARGEVVFCSHGQSSTGFTKDTYLKNLYEWYDDINDRVGTAATWAALAAAPGTVLYQLSEVAGDAGTHTDPVVGGTVSNSGRFRWSASPAGWERIGNALGAAGTGVRSVFGQADDIPFMCEHFPYVTTPEDGEAGVMDAILQAHINAVADPLARRIFVYGTTQQFLLGDEYHMISSEHFKNGALAGQAWAERKYEGSNNVPWITTATISGNHIFCDTNALFDLAIDTTTVPARANSGFVVTDAGGVVKSIASVTIRAGFPKQIDILMAVTPAVGWIVKYARTDTRTTAFGPGGRGSFRDTRGTLLAWDGITPLQQWLLGKDTVVT